MLGTPNDITWPGVSSNPDFVNGKETSMLFKKMIFGTELKDSLRPVHTYRFTFCQRIECFLSTLIYLSFMERFFWPVHK